MVKRYYIQDYSENFRGNTETRTVASDFIRPSIESSLTRRGKKHTDQPCGSVVRLVIFLMRGNSTFERSDFADPHFFLVHAHSRYPLPQCSYGKIIVKHETYDFVFSF